MSLRYGLEDKDTILQNDLAGYSSESIYEGKNAECAIWESYPVTELQFHMSNLVEAAYAKPASETTVRRRRGRIA